VSNRVKERIFEVFGWKGDLREDQDARHMKLNKKMGVEEEKLGFEVIDGGDRSIHEIIQVFFEGYIFSS
jgi:hypothetical protein